MIVFLKVKKINFFYQTEILEFMEIQGTLFTIQCAIEFSTNFVNTLFVYQPCFIIKSSCQSFFISF
jgi:hypothetical protein